MKHAIYGEIVHGKLHVAPSMRSAMQEALLVWPDGPVTLTVEREVATRSVQANAYYWAVVLKALADHTGYTPDELHEICKVKFLPKDVALKRGNGKVLAEFVIGGSTVRLSTVEFYDYVEQVRQWAFEALDVDVPPADPDWRAHVEEERERDRRRREAERTVQAGDVDLPRVEARRGRRGPRRLGDGRVVPPMDGPEGGANAA
jgi:hypothetical protein